MFKLFKTDKKNKYQFKSMGFNIKFIPPIFALVVSTFLLIANILFNFTTNNINKSKLPSPTIKSVANGSYFKSLSRKYADDFILSKPSKHLTNIIKKEYGINPINNVFITDNKLIYNVQTQNTTTSQQNSKAISNFIQKYSKDIPCYFGLIPTAIEIYKNELPSSYNTLNQSKFISDIYSEVSNSTIDIFSALSSQKNNYIFYNTDSSITSLGGYYVYTAIMNAMNKKPIPIDKFDVERIYHNFLGNLYDKTLIQPKCNDIIDLFHYTEFSVVDEVIKYNNSKPYSSNSIFFKDSLKTDSKLNVFLGSPSPIVKINTFNIGAPNVLIFKDDTINNLMQFLPLHFSNITLVDLDLIDENSLKNINLSDFDSILFLYNVDNFNNNNFINSKISSLL